MGTGLSLGIGIPFRRMGGGGTSFQGLLDLYPNASAAYSLRKLRAAYSGSAVRIRRSSDNAETDIGFLNNEFNSAAAQTFCGAGNGFITTWYDQSGNAYNVVQTTAASQPQIVSSGAVLLKNTKACASFTNSQELLSPSNFNLALSNTSVFSVMQQSTTGGTLTFGWGKAFNALKIRFFYTPSSNLAFAIWTNDAVSSISINDTTINQYTAIQTNNVVLSKNATNETVNFGASPLTTDNGSFGINGIQGTNLRGSINFSEGIFYAADKSADAAGIKLNQKTYYGTP